MSLSRRDDHGNSRRDFLCSRWRGNRAARSDSGLVRQTDALTFAAAIARVKSFST